MAEVYWIRKQEHTDIFTQGYVGVTSKTAQDRFKVHIDTANAKKSKKSVVHNAIKAIGAENLICETVIIAEEAYCYEVENKLRPEKSIGWNVAVGGEKPPGVKGLPVSQETRDKLSKALKGRPMPEKAKEALRLANEGRKLSDEHKAKISENLRNRPVTDKMIDLLVERNKARTSEKRSDESRSKQSETLKAKGYWNTPRADLQIWSLADEYHIYFSEGLSAYLTSKKLGLRRDQLQALFRHFKNGWIPLEDELWLKTFKEESFGS